MERLASALDYARRGIPVFPVNQDKIPAITDWQNKATTNTQQIRDWYENLFINGCNFGCTPGKAGLLVIDTDRHNPEEDGELSLKALEDEMNSKLPETFTVRTPSGGIHRYYKAEGFRSKNRFRPALDVKSNGGYVVIAGSYSDKGEYTIISDAPIADCPCWFENIYNCRVKEINPEEALIYNTLVIPDSDQNVSNAITLANAWNNAELGERNTQLYQLAREWCQCGITVKKAIEIYNDYAYEKIGLDPIEDQTEIANTIESAYKNQSDFGKNSFEVQAHIALTKFDSIPIEGQEQMLGLDWTDMEKINVPPRKWFVKNWLSADKGYTVLFTGQGGTGKSSLILELLRSLATGEKFLGMDIERGAKSMYVSCEESESELARRVQNLKIGRRVPEGVIRIISRLGKDNLFCTVDKFSHLHVENFYKELKGSAEEFFGRDGGVLVLDTLSDIFGGDENNRNHVAQFVKHQLNRLGQDLNVTIIVVAHPGKSNKGYSGSSTWEGAFRCRWELNYARENELNGLLTLTLAKSNMARAGEQLLLKNEGGILGAVQEVEKDDWLKQELCTRIAEAYEEDNPYGRGARSARPIEFIQITDQFSGSPVDSDTISLMIGELLAEGRIEVHKTKTVRVLRIPQN